MISLYITQQEQELLNALPADIREEASVVIEELESYETDEQLRIRRDMAVFDKDPGMQEVLKQVQNGETIEMSAFEGVSDEALTEFFFTIGARGLSSIIQCILQVASTAEDIQSAALFSQLRHDALMVNSSDSSS